MLPSIAYVQESALRDILGLNLLPRKPYRGQRPLHRQLQPGVHPDHTRNLKQFLGHNLGFMDAFSGY